MVARVPFCWMFVAVSVAAAAAPGGGFAQDAPAGENPAASSPDDQTYILGPADVIEIRVLGRSDFDVRTRIGQDGMIQLPYLGQVKAANQTTDELSANVKRALKAGGFYADPILSVEIVSYASRSVTVLGAVNRPGVVPVDRPYHLSEILARVGGTTDAAADYIIVRPEKGPQQQYSITGLITGDPDQDPIVQPGDRIFSPKAETFYISGQVKAPGTYSLQANMTLRMAIARGGGLTDLGSDHRLKVTHVHGKTTAGALDEQIEAGDVIVVGERLF